jgi:tetratricopeptide (TPR) repeat protein
MTVAAAGQGDRRMGLTVALVATIALAASAGIPQDAAGWRAQADALFAQGNFRDSLEAAERARTLDPSDPWSRYAWLRALAAVDAEGARRALPGLQEPEALKAFPEEERARLETALGYLCLDLGVEPLAADYLGAVPASATSYPKAQAGLAILAVRRGNSRQALVHFVAARATIRQDPSLAELERDARYEVVLREFATARDLRDANAAGRAYSVLDELRPNHPSTLQARADLAGLRGDQAARERALRELLAVDPQAPGAAVQLTDTLLALNRPYDAYIVARDLAPERLAADTRLQAIERDWVSHGEAAIDWKWRRGQTDHDRLEMPRVQVAWQSSHARWGRVRIIGDASFPESDRVPAGEPFGSAVALAEASETQSDQGIGALAQWSPRNGIEFEFGTTPTAFDVSNILGAIRYRTESDEGTWVAGVDRTAVEDSLLSYAGTRDPISGLDWGGVVRSRAYFGGRVGNDAFEVFGLLAGSILDGQRVDSNSEWRADAGFLQRAASGEGWVARVGGAVGATGLSANRGHFTLGHGGYFSPNRFLTAGPVFEVAAHHGERSLFIEGAVEWQEVRESASDFFPEDPAFQAASGNPRYPSDNRDGIGLRLAASFEWRISGRTVAGLRLEGVRGEDADLVRLQVYARRWTQAISNPVQQPPVPLRMGEARLLN